MSFDSKRLGWRRRQFRDGLETARTGTPAGGRLRPAGKKAAGGLLFGLVAYGYWGLMPVYFVAVREVPSGELLAHRIVWCALLMVLVLVALGAGPILFAACLPGGGLVF